MGRWVLGAYLFCMVSATLLFGQSVEPNFQQDPVEVYGSRALAGVLVFGILIVLYSLIRYRGHTGGPLSWGLLVEIGRAHV